MNLDAQHTQAPKAPDPSSHDAAQPPSNRLIDMDLDAQRTQAPPSVDKTSDHLFSTYETYDGGDPRSDEWRVSRLIYLRHLLQHLPDIGANASPNDYLGSTVYTSYDDWRYAFGLDNFGDFLVDDVGFGPAFKDLVKQGFGDRYIAEAAIENFSAEAFESVRQVAKSKSITEAQQKDGSVFWATHGSVIKIPDIIQSAFAHCPATQDPGLIDKCLVDIMNMAKRTYERNGKTVCSFTFSNEHEMKQTL